MKAALFDFDGVLVDTEPIYDKYWGQVPKRYGLDIENFVSLVKGTTLPDILDLYFSDRGEAFKQKIECEAREYEGKMDLPAMPGSFEFLRMLKSHGVKTAVVTSSDRAKIDRAITMHHLQGLFDTIVTAESITKGKPDPMCFLLAAERLNVTPAECLVFEDSFNGIKAGNSAGMRVIALSTTNPAASMQEMAYEVIPDFTSISFKKYLSW